MIQPVFSATSGDDILEALRSGKVTGLVIDGHIRNIYEAGQAVASDTVLRYLEDADITLRAIKAGKVDALMIGGRVYTLKSAEQPYRIFIEEMGEGALTIDLDGKILYCNDSFSQMAGLPPGELLNGRIQDFLDEGGAGTFEQALASGEKCRLELNLTGRQIEIPVLMTLKRLSVDGVDCICIVVTDLSQRKANEEIIRSNQELEHFANVASHDLQEPLRKIIIYSDRLKLWKDESLSAEVRDYFERMQSAALRMRQLVDDLMNFSKVTKTSGNFAAVDLRKVIDEVLVDLEERIEESSARVRVGVLPELFANEFQMKQLFLNLIGNSLKFKKDGVVPEVKIRGEALEPDKVRITVEDNGVGFDAKYRDKLFKPFQRLHSKKDYPGNGIGLAICRKIVAQHGGEIEADSRPGEGATFILTFLNNPLFLGKA